MTAATTAGLGACPFCPSTDPEMQPVLTQDKAGYVVICPACSGLGPTRRCGREAIAAWNHRATPDAATMREACAKVADAEEHRAAVAMAAVADGSPAYKAEVQRRGAARNIAAAIRTLPLAAPAVHEGGEAPTIPAGMKPWHGGDSAPEDWDGGEVLFRNGQTGHYKLANEWFPWSREEEAVNAENDIIAYTPKPTPADIALVENRDRIVGEIMRCSVLSKDRAETRADALAPLFATSRAGGEVREVRDLHDVITHRSAWREALNQLKTLTSDDNGTGYWSHEIRAFDRTFDKLAILAATQDDEPAA